MKWVMIACILMTSLTSCSLRKIFKIKRVNTETTEVIKTDERLLQPEYVEPEWINPELCPVKLVQAMAALDRCNNDKIAIKDAQAKAIQNQQKEKDRSR